MSSGPDIGTIITQNANSRTTAPKAVLSQLIVMTAVSFGTVVVFNVLRPSNKVVYEPKIKYHVGDKAPPRISDSTFGWISPLLHTKEAELVDKVGLDATTFLRFLRMFRWLFTAIAAIGCIVLIPVDVAYNIKHVDPKVRDALSILTIRDVKGNLLVVHVGATYVMTALVMAFSWIHWREMVRLRRDWFRSPEYKDSFYARTLVVTHVPKKFQSDEGIRAIFESVQVPYPTTAVHVGRRVGALPALVEEHNNTVRELEGYLILYLKDGKIASKRPTARIGGFMGMGGRKVDAIDYYTTKVQKTEAAVQQYRAQIDRNKAENYGFASMAAVPYAHIVARLLRNKNPKGTTITLAPNPKDIIWGNLTKSNGEIARKKMMGFIMLAFVCFINTLPLFVISILANLSSLTILVPFLQDWKNDSSFTFDLASGILPPAVAAAFGYVLPLVMRWLSQYQGALTTSRLDRAVVARYFAFLVISQLIIFTLIGVGINSVKQIIASIGHHASASEIMKNISDLPNTINTTYLEQSSYWLTFFPLRGFLAVFDLAQIINLVWIFIKTRLFGRTPRDIRDWTQPPDFQYAIYYSNMLFMGCVALVFAPLAPLVALGAAIVFWVSSWVYKYQLMFVYVTRVETGGRLWNVVINRLLFSVILMQLLMTLTMGLQYGWRSFVWVSTLPPVIIIAVFKSVLRRTFDNAFRYFTPSEAEVREAKIHSERTDVKQDRLGKRFGHPALHAELFTPMVHKKMIHLLGQVFSDKIGQQKMRMDEMGGQKVDAAVVDGNVRIAAIDERDLEYDAAQYRRDRGEQDWDARSVAGTNLLGNDAASLAPSKSLFYANGRSSPAPSQYDRYRAAGPSASTDNIELTRFATGVDDKEPLLPPQLYGQRGLEQSTTTLNYTPSAAYQTPPADAYQSPPGLPYQISPAGMPLQHPERSQSQFSLRPGQSPSEGYREAPLHRPYPSDRHGSPYASESEGEFNMAGRGARAQYRA